MELGFGDLLDEFFAADPEGPPQIRATVRWAMCFIRIWRR
jgi:hypothetical protein